MSSGMNDEDDECVDDWVLIDDGPRKPKEEFS